MAPHDIIHVTGSATDCLATGRRKWNHSSFTALTQVAAIHLPGLNVDHMNDCSDEMNQQIVIFICFPSLL